jgi:SAM-dependent methyltransferase
MKKEIHRKRFDSVASYYKTEKYPGRYNCLLFVLDYLDPSSSDIILDVGCGPGTQLIEMSPYIDTGYGVDLSEEMIKIAKDRAIGHKNLKFMISSAESFPAEITDIGINKIYSNYALHHLPDDLKSESIRNMAKALETGGKVILGDLMLSESPNQYASIFDYVGYGPGNDTPSTVSNLESMFKNAGLKPIVRLLTPVSGVIIGTKI